MGVWSQLYHLIAVWDYESHLTFLNLGPHSPLQQNWANDAYHTELLWRSTITIQSMLCNQPSAIISFTALRKTQVISPIDTTAMKNKWVKGQDQQGFWKKITVRVPSTGLPDKVQVAGTCVCLHTWITVVTVVIVRKGVARHCSLKWNTASASEKRGMLG